MRRALTLFHPSLLRTLSLICLLCVLRTAGAAGLLPMWEIHDPQTKGTVYLLGSIHVCKDICVRFNPAVTKRFARSDALVVELDPNAPGNLSALQSAAVLPDGESLLDKLPAERRQQFERVSAKMGFPAEPLARLRPSMASTSLELVAATQSGFSPEAGVDEWFLQRASETRKPVITLETIDEQIAALNAGSEAEQLQELYDTLDLLERNQYAQTFDAMLNDWLNGDLDGIAKIMHDSMNGQSNIEDALLRNRNLKMAQNLETHLRSGEVLFVVIGAAHISGHDNVAELLAKRGFITSRVHSE